MSPKLDWIRFKRFYLFLINFLLFPYVLGHFDDQFCACDFAIVKRNCTAFRLPGKKEWQIFDPQNSPGQSVTTLSPRKTDWTSYDFQVFRGIFEAEQFSHPLRAAIVETVTIKS